MSDNLSINIVFATKFAFDIMPDISVPVFADTIISIAEQFTTWESDNIYVNGKCWEDYGNDYESELYAFVKAHLSNR